jgi:arylsulfatase A-like enzyme
MSMYPSLSTVMDILPTVLGLAGVPLPGSTFRNREVVEIRGRSWVPYLSKIDESIHQDPNATFGWELFGRRAIRRGNWKAVYIPAPHGPDEWELYDLTKDQGETENLAAVRPDILEDLLLEYTRYSEETGVFDPELRKAVFY